MAAVIAFSEVLADVSAPGKYALALHDTGRLMRLDAAAQRALNVLPQRTDANDSFSLYGLLNRGRTTMARRLLKVPSLPRNAWRGSWQPQGTSAVITRHVAGVRYA